MEVIAIPQTPIKIMCKKFNTLYYLNKELNTLFKQAQIENDKIKVVQVFFDTEIPKDKEVEFLKLRDGILQIVAPFDWNGFSKLEEIQQKKVFIEHIQKYFLTVVEKYNLQKDIIDSVFKKYISTIME